MSASVSLLKSVHRAARRLASSENFNAILREVLTICVEAVGAEGGTIYLHDKANRRLQFRHVLPDEVAKTLQLQDIPDDFGVAGSVFQSRKTEISNFDPSDPERAKIDEKIGTRPRTMITVPLMMEDMEPIGVVQLINKRTGTFDEDDVMVLDTVSAISTMAYLNSLLLDQQVRSSQLLGMGKVAHDIKNMAFALEANVSFSDHTIAEVRRHIAERSPGDGVLQSHIDTVEVMFDELAGSIDRIKRYSILMSDLSAGKPLNPEFKLASAAATVENAAAFLESEGRSNFVAIRYDIQNDAQALLHDEMYLFRIVQNLVSNAIKAVAEVVPPTWRDAHQEDGEPFGEVVVRYCYAGGVHCVEVEDQGPGMSPETVEKILTGNARSLWDKSSGSGWGTKIVLELAATHRACVEIDSEQGKGSTFRVRFPQSEAGD